MILIKAAGKKHFTREFGQGTVSHRVILPTPDKCGVKVTLFQPRYGFISGDIVYNCDETCYVVRGSIWLKFDGQQVEVKPGDCWHVPAGMHYSVEVAEDSEVFCVFSASRAPLPDDE